MADQSDAAQCSLTNVREVSKSDKDGATQNASVIVAPSISSVQQQPQQQQPNRRIKPIPPPLDLSKHGPLIDHQTNPAVINDYGDFSISSISPNPRSPLNQNQKHLPFRKRSVNDDIVRYCLVILSSIQHIAEHSVGQTFTTKAVATC